MKLKLAKHFLVLGCALLTLSVAGWGQNADPVPALTIDDVFAMVKGGLSEDVIILAIRKEQKRFDLSTLQLLELKKSGATDNVLKVMIDPSAQLEGESAPEAEPRAAAAPPDTGSSPLGPNPEVGVYAKKKGEWVEVLPEVVTWKTGGVLKMVATAGVVKGDVNGHLPGPHSRNTLVSPAEFIIHTPEGVAITEYQLLRLRPNKNYREFRTVTGGILHMQGGAMRDVVPFEAKKLRNRMFEVLLPSNLGAGEYGFLPPGVMTSASSASVGRLYSFRILE